MTWICESKIRIARRDDRLTAELPGGEALRYAAHEVAREEGEPDRICSTIDHIVAAAGW
jgi:hypothetical protein